MPRYLFNLVSDYVQVPDRDGIDLADSWAARREAFLVADELVKPGTPAQRRKWQGWSVQVVDESGHEVLFVPVVELIGAPAADHAGNRNAPLRRLNGVPGRTRKEAYNHSLRLAAEAIRHAKRCQELRHEVAQQIALAKETARLSAQLIEQARTLSAASPTG